MRPTALAIAAMLAMGEDVPEEMRPKGQCRYHRLGTPPDVVARIKAKAEAKRQLRARRRANGEPS